MADKINNISYYLRKRTFRALDEASEEESDHEEVEEHFSEEEEASSDSDFDTPKKQRILQEKNDEPEEEIEKTVGRPKSIIRGKNNFKWSKNAPESQGVVAQYVHIFLLLKTRQKM